MSHLNRIMCVAAAVFFLGACSSSNMGSNRSAASGTEELMEYDLSYSPDEVGPFNKQDVADYVNERVIAAPGFIQEALEKAALVWGDQSQDIRVSPKHIVEVASFRKSTDEGAGAIRIFRVFVPSPKRDLAGAETTSFLMELEIEASYAKGVVVYRGADGSAHRDISVRSYKANFSHPL